MRLGSVQLKITGTKWISMLHADHYTASVHSPLDNTEANSHHYHYRCYSITNRQLWCLELTGALWL